MDYFVVNDNAQPTGEHEVHKRTCIYFNKIKSYTELGYFFSCKTAVIEAKKKYNNVDGCKECVPACHNR